MSLLLVLNTGFQRCEVVIFFQMPHRAHSRRFSNPGAFKDVLYRSDTYLYANNRRRRLVQLLNLESWQTQSEDISVNRRLRGKPREPGFLTQCLRLFYTRTSTYFSWQHHNKIVVRFAHRVVSLIGFATAHLISTIPKALVWAASKGTVVSRGISQQRETQGWGAQRAKARAGAQSHHPR